MKTDEFSGRIFVTCRFCGDEFTPMGRGRRFERNWCYNYACDFKRERERVVRIGNKKKSKKADVSI